MGGLTLDQVRNTLAFLDVHLRVEGDRLLVDAPDGALTDELRTEIAAHKPALIELLTAGYLPSNTDAEPSDQDLPNPPSREVCPVTGEPRPTAPHHCGATDWWLREPRNSGGWVCGLCHPPYEVAQAEWQARRASA